MSHLPTPSERFQRVRGLFDLAVNTPPDAIEEVLSAHASGDRSLIDEVKRLLAAHREASGFLSEVAIEVQISDDHSSAGSPSAQSGHRPAITPGTRVAVYEVGSMLGSGGMGEVYLGTDLRLDRPVALKLLPGSGHDSIERVRRFEYEARAASALNHPNIVTIYDIADSEHGRFIAMELVAGHTLREVIADRPTTEVVVPLARQIAQALRVAHASGIVHRDIKPENIMVRPDGYVKVLDFGLARLVAVDPPPYAEPSVGGMTPRIFGTVRYMSPEQSRGEDLTGASDIFSFGLVLYELATAQHPFPGESAITVMHALRTHAQSPAAELNADVPAALSELIQDMLQKDYRLRPTAAMVEQRLAAFSAAPLFPDTSSQPLTHRTPRTVGRDREIAELRRAFDEVRAGRGAMIAVSGEAGAGKTTLVEEFLADFREDDDSCLIVRGRCSERLAGTEVYLPWLEALDHLLHDERRAIPARLISELAPTWFHQIARAASVASTEQARADLASGSKERLKLELTALLQELSRHRPVILFFDDVHWADASTVELLSFVADRFDALRLLVITTYRPSDLMLANHLFAHTKHGLHARGVLRDLSLAFLGVEDIQRYLALQFPEHRFPNEVAARIHRRTEGSPLFMTDLVRYLRTQNIFAQDRGRWVLAEPLEVLDRQLPESVRGMIERKIGQLDEAQRRLLVAASVQGHEFDSGVIADVLALDSAEVEEQLGTLERVHEFVTLVEEREFPDRTLTSRYRFKHVLYQNALYGLLKPTRKTQLSLAVARSLETHWGERRHEMANDLALLFETAREYAPAAEYCRVAALSASELFASREAEALARRGLAVIDKLPPGADRLRSELAMQLVMGNALIATRGYAAPEVESAFLRAGELCRQLGDIPQLLPVHFGLSAFHLVKGQARIALTISHEFLNTAERSHDPAIIVGQRHIGTALFYLGEPLATRAHLERASAGYDPSRHRSLTTMYGGEPEMNTRSYLGLTLWLLGYPDQAMASHQHALRLAAEVSHAHSRAHTTAFAAVQYQLRHDWRRVSESIQQLLGLTTGQGLVMWHTYASTMRGWVMMAEGDIKEGLTVMQAGLERLRSFGVKLFQPYFHALIAEALLDTGQAAEGLAVLDRARSLVEETEERFWDAELMRIRGELLAARGLGKLDEAEAEFLTAIEYARSKQTRSFELRAVMSLSRLWQRQGRRDDARVLLADTYGCFTEGFGTADLQAAQLLLQQLS